MAEYSAVAVQTVNPGESVVFTATTIPCTRGLVQHSDETGNFLLSGWVPSNNGCPCCNNNNPADYLVDFGANITVPTGGTPGEISVAFAVDGSTLPASAMMATPAAIGDFFNVARSITVEIFNGCCQTLTIRNTSDQAINVQNATVRITRPDLLYSR